MSVDRKIRAPGQLRPALDMSQAAPPAAARLDFAAADGYMQ
ncbi:hypothetical protein [Methylocella silvestris]|nr:hypothetical protein [Methylocella silvestris]